MPLDTPTLSDKQTAILVAAFEVFCAYGYKRTSMEDIANAAGMSRAALYQHFRNKTDIFQSLGQLHYEKAVNNGKAELVPGGDPIQVLPAFLTAIIGPGIDALLTSPHGAEIMGEAHAVNAEIAQQAQKDCASLLSSWLSAEAEAGRITLAPFGGDADSLATTFVTSYYGFKGPGATVKSFKVSVHQVAMVFAHALAQPKASGA